MNLIASHPRKGLPTIHATGCTHSLRGLIREPGPHSIRVGIFASCVAADVERAALTSAFDGWHD